MALSVLKTRGAIHPMVGSIFSTPKPRVPFEALDEVENPSTRDGREFAHKSVSTASTSSPTAIGSRAVAHDVENTQPAKPSATIQSAALPFSPRSDPERPSSVQPNAVAPDDRRAELSGKVVASEATPVKRTFTPLIAAALKPSPPPLTSRSPGKPNADAAKSFASRSRATDDIEIHIGRIEVAAMQAAPIRSAPAKPLRRAASLDEYLKRRDGSAS
jgi:hypothetical protein